MTRSRRLAATLLCVAALSGCVTAPVNLNDAAAHLPPRFELQHVAFHPQADYQCGPAALATVLNASDVQISPASLTPEVYLPGRQGSLQLELAAAARARDRLVYEPAGELSDILAQLVAGYPVLVLQNLGLKSAPAWHFAVVVGYDRSANELYLRSGTERRLVVTASRFQRTWDYAGRWSVIVLKPEQMPAQADLQRFMRAAAALEATGRLNAAAAAYERAHSHWPESVWPVLGLANISQAQGNAEIAERRYVQALALDPNNAAAHNNLAELLMARGCSATAKSHIERALGLSKGTALEPAIAEAAKRMAQLSDSHSGVDCPKH